MGPFDPRPGRIAALGGALTVATSLAVASGASTTRAAGDPAPAGPAPAAPFAVPATQAIGAAVTAPAPTAHPHLSAHAVRRTVIAGSRTVVRGRLRGATKARRVVLQARRAGRWATVDHATTRASSGAFRIRYRPTTTGVQTLRVAAPGADGARPVRARLRAVRVYRRVFVSYYALFGSHLACGGTLEPGTLGVAHKSLPCGTKVTLHYRGRTVRVPVVDRGPYVGGREYDLTAATRARLRAPSTATILATR